MDLQVGKFALKRSRSQFCDNDAGFCGSNIETVKSLGKWYIFRITRHTRVDSSIYTTHANERKNPVLCS